MIVETIHSFRKHIFSFYDKLKIVEKRMDENHLDDSITLNDTFDCAKCIVECTKRPFFSVEEFIVPIIFHCTALMWQLISVEYHLLNLCTKEMFGLQTWVKRIVRSDKLSMIQEIISCIANIVICIIEQTEILVSCVKANVREQLALKNAKTRFLVEAKLDELFDKLEEMRQFEEGT